MQYHAKAIFISSFLVFALLISGQRETSKSIDECEDEREFDYRKGSKKGPDHWGKIKQEWAACRNGKMQSPIDMSNQRVKLAIKSADKLIRHYKPTKSCLKNRGHDISIQWANHTAGKIQLNGIDYYLEQGHWHSPSEHTINGRHYDLELHMVHKSKDPKVKNMITVVALLYQIGPPNRFITKLLGNITALSHQMDERNMGILDPNEIKMRGKKYYRYLGSLTTPPCTEGVIWIINEKIYTVSRRQIRALRTSVHDFAQVNARPLQPINNRYVALHGPKK